MGKEDYTNRWSLSKGLLGYLYRPYIRIGSIGSGEVEGNHKSCLHLQHEKKRKFDII